MIEYKDFWNIVYDVRDEKKIKKAVRELNPIQVEEVIGYLALLEHFLKGFRTYLLRNRKWN